MGVVAAGIVGALAAGTIPDWVFKSRRPPVAFIGYSLQTIRLRVISWAPSLTLVLAAFLLNSFAMSMVHSMLSGTASMNFGGKKTARAPRGCSTACNISAALPWASAWGGFWNISAGEPGDRA
jgi:OPA family glycerol-3-phosphate transporter-like MFS transporter